MRMCYAVYYTRSGETVHSRMSIIRNKTGVIRLLYTSFYLTFIGRCMFTMINSGVLCCRLYSKLERHRANIEQWSGYLRLSSNGITSI
jgi:hypothetical protein